MTKTEKELKKEFNIFGKDYSEKYVYGLMHDFLPALSRFLKGGYLFMDMNKT